MKKSKFLLCINKRGLYRVACSFLQSFGHRPIGAQYFFAEDMAARELENQGFTVVRFGGRTYDPTARDSERHQVNLFNFVSATTPAGKKLVVSMGCPPAFQERFRTAMAPYMGEDGTIEFLDESWSQLTLSLSGGIECMTKSLPVRLRLR